MKNIVTVLGATLLIALSPLNAKPGQSSDATQGIDEVEVIKAKATVEKIDLEKRKVTLQMEDGKKKTVKVDKDVRNLDQVKVGDHLKLSYTEEMIVVVGKSNDTPGAAGAGAVSVAPKGAKPGAVMVDTEVMTGKILAVDAKKHRVSVEEPDGKNKNIKLGKKVDLSKLQAGETFEMAVTESLVVEIVK